MNRIIYTTVLIIIALYIIGLVTDKKNKEFFGTMDAVQIRNSFIDGCIEEEGMNMEFCKCMYESLDQQVGTKGIIKIAEKQLREGTLDIEAHIAVDMCIHNL